MSAISGSEDRTYPPSLENATSRKSQYECNVLEKEREDVPATVVSEVSDELDYPDGGFRAWLVIFGAACVTFSTFGYVNTWGSFQAYYEETLLAGTSASTIAWIGSIQYSLCFLPSLFIGRLFDLGYFRVPFLSSSALLIVCTFLIPECTAYWQILLCQGLGIGIACGIVFGPTMAIAGHWFKKRRATALGLISIGSSTGGTLYPIIFGQLVPKIGFAWTMRVFGFLLLGALAFANLVLRRRLPPKNVTGGLMNLRQFRNPAFSLYTAAGFICFLGLYTVLSFINASAPTQGVSSNLVPYMVALGNTGSAVGRLITGMLGDKYGIMNIMIPFTFMASLFTYIWPFAYGNGPVVTITILYGVSSGAFVGLIAGPTMSMGPVEDVGRRTGMYFTITAFGALAGPPISGAIASATGSYKPVGIYAGSSILVGIIFLLWSRYCVLEGWKGRV
ncbi:MFS general substrate transporter [Vararia minispora EC-137]|uniref:MFS general substrate transporter n=1 Tax=Vararia minispora EC-137 TaxID=1314806 RepID=A0ACB8QTN4_9AGAM|nr:MFS general substrate transporter [Vararia minispora EC-137]